jgi:hypothetical protein
VAPGGSGVGAGDGSGVGQVVSGVPLANMQTASLFALPVEQTSACGERHSTQPDMARQAPQLSVRGWHGSETGQVATVAAVMSLPDTREQACASVEFAGTQPF